MRQQIAGSFMASRLGQKYAKKKLGENMDILLAFQQILKAEGHEEEAKSLVKDTLSLCAKLAAAKSDKTNKESSFAQRVISARDAVWVFLEDLHTLCWARLRSGVAENEALDELRRLWAHTHFCLTHVLTRRLGQKDVLLFDAIAAQLENAVVLILTQPHHCESLAKVKTSLNSLLASRLQ